MPPPFQKKTKVLPVILSGGVGSRLWPLSREAHPKPFIRLDDNQSLIQKTYLRAASIDGIEEIVTVTNRALFFYTKDEYDEVALAPILRSFILEPFGRNSAAAIGLAAHYAKSKFGNDCILLVLPADHLVEKQDAFMDAINQAMILASDDKLVTFGIRPDTPKTGYGYIEADGHNVLRFVEKPNLDTAQGYLDSGNYFWNSGMFCMCAGTIIEEMHAHCPKIPSQSNICLENAKTSVGASWLLTEISAQDFEKVEDISIDYAIFERSEKVAVVTCDIGWSDIGSWLEFGQLHPLDENNNHISGEAVLEDAQDCILHSEHRMIAGIGLRDLIIADTSDALLVADKSRVQDVRTIVKKLKTQGHKSYEFSPTVYRPWGNYTVLQEGDGFKLKRIEVKPRASLSLQSHAHRSEHWIVVSGVAKVVNHDQILALRHNQSTYIPIGNKHRLENPGDEMLILIEVQCGNYLEETDIIRYNE
uniref:mannose-1-phosphate guanylyltransferase n=1 Tax=Candidatus Kentrum sp. UNK TaxID=2126344 RepID=A0A451AY66_9GAMM|nr:MAG: mannose-1-phosphate guanylyltransferase [Candidatus Kentron sp. UNK]VFK70927.1 MAG: mannose-1-phosphate guanylyltransferase [Candidatus Kentron sp. UNK]